ncbi:MAG: type II toxin-antitoxin system VapC family toxin [Candidatus Hadarchaeota archaeon]|nr:type II toxin-antitoxin system VapC family toxin [Candidatus Hadarchaeota archaeon]
MIYLDTNIWIYAITAHPKYGKRCKRILERLEKEKLRAAISVQVLSEVAGVLYQQFGVKDTTKHVAAILSYPLEIVDLTPDIIIRGAEYSRDYGVLPYDGIHIASALGLMIKKILSADRELGRVSLIERVDPIDTRNVKDE